MDEAVKDPSLTDTSMDGIRQQVKERLAREASQSAPPEASPEITSKLIRNCLFANELGYSSCILTDCFVALFGRMRRSVRFALMFAIGL